MYLKLFPTITYGNRQLTDITRKVIINDEIRQNASLWRPYTVIDGEYPEDVAYNFYGSAVHVNIVMLMNDIIDPFYGWVLPIDVFDEYVKGKYGSKLNDVHHHEKDGMIVNHDVNGAVPISNLDYEFRINESKRHIRILNPEYLERLLDEMKIKIHQDTRDGQIW